MYICDNLCYAIYRLIKCYCTQIIIYYINDIAKPPLALTFSFKKSSIRIPKLYICHYQNIYTKYSRPFSSTLTLFSYKLGYYTERLIFVFFLYFLYFILELHFNFKNANFNKWFNIIFRLELE